MLTTVAVSDAEAVTMASDPTSRESVAFAVASALSALSVASRALPTWMMERSESDMVAAPAATRATAARSCCCACSSWTLAAACCSRAASTAKYCCFTSRAMANDCETSVASAASTFARAVMRSK